MLLYGNKKVSTPQVYLISFYPYPETDITNEFDQDFHYKSLVYTYDLNCQVVYGPEEIMLLPDLPIVSLEERNGQTVDIRSFEHPRDCIYMTGNSLHQKPANSLITQNPIYRVAIPTPTVPYEHPLYGDQAAAIALHDRYMKSL